MLLVFYASKILAVVVRSIIRDTNKTKGAYCSLVLRSKTTSLIEDFNSERATRLIVSQKETRLLLKKLKKSLAQHF